jgi:hypothetical protein
MIDQRFIEDLAQDLVIAREPEPVPEMQLASANTGVTTDGGAFVGTRLNMPKGLNTRENMAKQSTLIANTLGGGTLGGGAAGVGLAGDIVDIILMGANALGADMPEKSGLWTTEDVTGWLASKGINQENISGLIDKVLPSSATEEEKARAFSGGQTAGEFAAPGTQLSLIGKAGKEIVKGGVKVGKKIIEAGKDLPVGMSIKAVDESLDPLGFYSAASKAVDNIAQEKGTGAQFLAQIEKTPGVKKEELLWTGLDEFLAGKKSVTKAEVQDYLKSNRVEVKETTLGGGKSEYPYRTADEWQSAINNAEKAKNFDEAERITAAWEDFDLGTGSTKFAKYQLPGGENYREVMLTMPNLNVQKFDPSKVEIVRNRQSATQGTYTIKYDGKEIQTYGDEFNVKDGYKGLSDNEIMQTAKDLYEKGNKFQQIKPMSGEFRSQHFDQPNVLAHMRLNDRVDADGKKVLFVEEVQSDWHQAGRKKGYEPENKVKLDAELKSIQKERFKLQEEKMTLEELADPYVAQGKDAPAEIVDKWSYVSNRINELQSAEDRLGRSAQKGVPDAPFKTSWHELALKRAIQLASEGGYDRIAFTTGKTQAERYDLSKQISELRLSKDGELKARTSQNPGIFTSIASKVTVDNLADYVGKDVAAKLLDATPNDIGARNLKGVDLQVGGEGMAGFYDKILPKYLDKYGKKWDAKTGMTEIPTSNVNLDNKIIFEDGKYLVDAGDGLNYNSYDTKAEAIKSLGGDNPSVHYMDITPKMKESVLTKGQPLFQMAPAIPAGVAAGQQEDNK